MPEVKFINDNKDTLMSEVIKNLRTRTNFTNLSPGSKARALAEVMTDVMSYQIGRIRVSQAVNLLPFATGQYLDALGEILGVARFGESTAESQSYNKAIKIYTLEDNFGLINNGADIFLAEGTEIYSSRSNNSNSTYELSEDTILSADQQEVYVSVRAKLAGNIANVGEGELDSISFTGYTDSINGSLLVQNVHAINEGRNSETDDNFRFRIANQAANLATANEMSIRLAAYSVPGVGTAYINRHTRGIGTAELTILATSPRVPDSLLAAVEAQVRGIEAAGNYVSVVKPKETGVEVRLTVYYDSTVNIYNVKDIEQSITNNIFNYVNSLELGAGLYLNSLSSAVFGADSRIKDIGIPGQPFDSVYIYSDYRPDSTRIKRPVKTNYLADRNERITMETSIATPVTITSIY